MDNITHSLYGFALAKLLRKKDPSYEKAAILTAVIGSNLPDVDFALQAILQPGRLSYLLQHRGYSHTLIFSIPLGIFSAWIGSRVFKIELKNAKGLWILGWISVLFHIAADFCNNYGVHPFFPFQNSWFYGDTLFILEPLIWLSCLPFLYFRVQSKSWKVFSIILQILMEALIWTKGYTQLPISLGLTVWNLGFNWISKKTRSLVPVFLGIGFTFFIFIVGHGLAQNILYTQTHVEERMPGDSYSPIDLALTPAPGNPFCWLFIQSAMIKHASSQIPEYSLKMGYLSLLPKFILTPDCFPNLSQSKRSTPLSNVSLPKVPGIYWIGEYNRPLKELVYYKNSSCHFSAFLHFSRMPVWFFENGKMQMADLRYDGGGRGFTQIPFDSEEKCPEVLPSWIPPIASFLEGILDK